MTTQPYESDYPYAPQPVSATIVKPARPRRPLPWKGIWRWTKRLAFVAIAAFALTALLLVAPLIRARRQAAKVAELQRRGCIVTYAPKIWGYDWGDSFPGSLRALFGDDFASEVGHVSLFRGEDEGSISADDTRAICEICAQFPKLQTFRIASESFTFDQIRHWPQLKQLQELSIRSPKLTDNDLREIAQITELVSLDLASSQVTAAGLAELGALQQLKILTLEGVSAGPETPASTNTLPNLIYFQIQKSPEFSDRAVLGLPAMPELNSLHLEGTAIGDEGLARFAAGHKLQDVTLSDLPVTDVGIKSLATNIELRMLDVSGTKITDEGLASLAPCVDITYLAAKHTTLTGRGFDTLAGSSLTLYLDHTSVDDDGLAAILKNPNIHSVSLQDTSVTGTGVSALNRSEPLSELSLDGAPLSLAGLAELANVDISSISLSRTPLTDQQLLLFANNDDIAALTVKGTKVTAEGITAFYEARKLRLDAAGKTETLIIESDFPEAVEPYFPKDEFLFIDGTPLDIAPPPPDPEPSQPSDPPPAEPPQPM